MRRKKDKSNGITALYERLSRDDDNAGESNSIVHQKQMLEDYAMKHGFTNLVHFTDDGWSGATFDRPSWNRLVEGVKNGEITACICKDMSRIGRDHLQVGFFTDILFREKEVRFIAINNGIDSDRQETSEFAPFLNIMNEWFVRDTSKKIKAVLKSRGSSGNAHTSNIPPYGYLKDPENPDHWIIDEEAAEVVRRIYRMTIEGKGPYQIARELSEEKIERPSYYLGKKGLGNHASNYDKENPYMWRGNQVTTLIARPEYIGKTVNFRTFKNSYKDKKTKRADKEDWVVFDDTQEPIVDEETWLLAQKLRQNVRKADPMGEPNVLTGKIYCADCGAPMYNHRQRKGRERIYYTAKGEKRTSYSNPADCYECSTYNLAYQKYDRHCTCHHISTKALKSIILKTIQETCHYVSLNEREFVYSLQEESAMKDIAVSETVKNRIERNQKRVHELDMLIRKIYEDNVIGRLPDRLFQSIPTALGNSLITVLPEQLQSPLLTAEWEQQLSGIQKGVCLPDDFLDGICAMLTELIQSYRPVAGADILFPSDEKVIGKCPRCGSKIVERSKGYFCTNRDCTFILWRDSRFFTLKQKTLDRKTAAKLLEKGKAPLKGCVSPRTGQVYDATVLLEDDGIRPSFKLVFGNG